MFSSFSISVDTLFRSRLAIRADCSPIVSKWGYVVCVSVVQLTGFGGRMTPSFAHDLRFGQISSVRERMGV